MADEPETLLERRQREKDGWIARVFGTPEAYKASLPRVRWEMGDCGWVSCERD